METAENTQQHEENKTNALLRAAYEGNVELMLKMISDGIPVDVANQGGLQAIHFAAKAGRVDVTDELLAHGAKVDAKSTKGNTPLHVASLLGQADIVKLLLRHGADVNAIAEYNDEEFTPLYMAAQIGHQEIVTLLLAHGADPTIPTTNGCTPCDVALQQGFKAVSELLAEYEKRMNEAGSPSPPKEQERSPEKESSPDDAKSEEDAEKTKPEAAFRRGNPTRTPRPKSGPPPVCDEAIPSPKPSPMRTVNKKASP